MDCARRVTLRSLLATVVAAAAFFLALSPGAVRQALAEGVFSPETRIEAEVERSGELLVSERRAFAFSGAYHGVFFDIDVSDGVGCTVESVAVQRPGEEEVAFTESSSGKEGTYEISREGDALRVKVYAAAESSTMTVEVAYRLSGVVKAWDDVAELYWMFVSPGWEMASSDVLCEVALPIDAPFRLGEEVRAWGHGELTGEVSLSERNGRSVIVFSAPDVQAGQFAEARVTFPASWVSLASSGGERLAEVIDEESAWVDEANVERERARREEAGPKTDAIASWACVGGLFTLFGIGALKCLRYRRAYLAAHAPAFTGEYWRDVPCPYHPAVAGVVIFGERLEDDRGGGAFSASVVRLADEGALAFEGARDDKGRVRGYDLVRGEGEGEDEMDAATSRLVFSDLSDIVGGDGERLSLSGLKAAARMRYREWRLALLRWHERAAQEAQGLGLTSDGSEVAAKSPTPWMLICFGATIALFLLSTMISAPLGLEVYLLGFIGLLAFALLFVLTQRDLRPMSSEAVEIKAKARALRKWLTEFTNLKEAPPTDVVLWNRLMVWAALLGVAKEAAKGLRLACPEVWEDPDFSVSRALWSEGDFGSPMGELDRSFEEADRAYRRAVASSSDSSPEGSGGGFSGGGGGGYGSSGGGGAF